jgi:acid phosphatase
MLLVAAAVAQRLPSTTAPAGAVRDTHEMLNAVLWIQTSAEYRYLCEGAYAAARDNLDKALADPTWTAAVEQTGDFSKLPPALILDIDETVLEHSAYQAELVKRGISSNSRAWREFVQQYRTPAVPGAVEFIQYARSRGVTVFFVTNREPELEDATRRNLKELGVDLPESPDTLLVAGEQPGWTSDKSSRRALLARSYRILIQCGDDFGDFLAGANNTPDRRNALAGEHKQWWGRRWFLLPNPLTGSWTVAVTRGASPMSESQSLDYRRLLVKGYDSVPKLAP